MEGKFQVVKGMQEYSPKMAANLPSSKNCKIASVCGEAWVRRSLVEDKFGEEARSSGTVKAVIDFGFDLLYVL